MRVQTELVLEQLVSRLLGRALEMESAGLPDEADRILSDGPEPTRLARLGYASRVAETEMFTPAREAMPLLSERISAGEPLSQICRELAAEEPDGKPDPGEGSWLVPGPGGHVRHFLALAAADEVVHSGADYGQAGRDLAVGEAKRCFLYGFYARCCEEAAGREQTLPRR